MLIFISIFVNVLTHAGAGSCPFGDPPPGGLAPDPRECLAALQGRCPGVGCGLMHAAPKDDPRCPCAFQRGQCTMAQVGAGRRRVSLGGRSCERSFAGEAFQPAPSALADQSKKSAVKETSTGGSFQAPSSPFSFSISIFVRMGGFETVLVVHSTAVVPSAVACPLCEEVPSPATGSSCRFQGHAPNECFHFLIRGQCRVWTGTSHRKILFPNRTGKNLHPL